MVRRTVMRGTLAGLALGLAFFVSAPAGASTKTPTRYSLAGGCYALQTASGQAVAGAERLRMQATDLGSYLLFTPDQKVLAAQGDGTVAPDEEASPAADWRLGETGGGVFTLAPHSNPDLVLALGPDGALAVVAPGAAGNTSRFRFAPAEGCPAYPEAELNATGKPSKGKTPYGAVGGLLEGHMHWMTFEYFGGEFHCGRPWHRYGIPYALPDCSEVEGPQGTAAPFQNFLNYGNPGQAHDTTGWPKLTEWSKDNVTYEGTYWKWIERAWLSGLRLMVMGVNENRVLCELQPRRTESCDEMETVRRGFRDMKELQRYVDAQAGGPGKGFFQIVTNPFEARRVINQGKMAVVLEIEVSELFGCRGWETSTCDREQIDQQLDEFYDMGVRSSLLLNKFDNPLAGVRFDSGEAGVLINAGNRQSAGSFWSAETCTGPYADNEIETFQPEGSATFDALLGAVGVTSGEVPTYPPAPHCNTRGLTNLGRYLEKEMIERKMIINPDHMSQAAVDDTLTLAEASDYSGVISPHGWMDPGNWPRIWRLGGLAFPDSEDAGAFVGAYDKYRPKRTPYELGWGYGADLGGLANQPAPPETPIDYPFTSYDGKVTFERQTTGERTFDYNQEGVAHYGLYADWFNDMQNAGGERLAADMWNASEAYLEMWERASGIPARGCKPTSGHVNGNGLGRIDLGDRWEGLLRRAGQPQQRGRAWSYCVRGKKNGRAADVAELSKRGRVELVASTAHGRSADGIAVGNGASRLRGAEGVGGGVFTRGRYVFAVEGGDVEAVGVATARLAGKDSKVRAAMRRAKRAKATQGGREFVPNESGASTRLTGTNLASTQNPNVDRALVLLCSLQGG